MDILIYLGVFAITIGLAVLVVVGKKKGWFDNADLEAADLIVNILYLIINQITIKEEQIKENIEDIITYVLQALTLAQDINEDMTKEQIIEYANVYALEILGRENFEITEEVKEVVSTAVKYIANAYIK